MSSLETVKNFYDCLARGDVPGLIATLHSSLSWTEAEGFPYYGGTWSSPQEIVDNLLIPLNRDWEGFSATAHEFIESGDRAVALGNYSGTSKATRKTVRAPFAHVWTVRDGKIATFNMYTDTLLFRDATT